MLVGYARVSTGEQNLDLQTDALEGAGCERIFTDTVSGAKADRPGLADALDFIRAEDTLVVWKLDRLGRSLKDLIGKVEELDRLGAGFKSLHEGIDTTTPAGKLTFHLFGALAEFERDIIRQRTLAGLEAARRRGRKGGRPRALSEEDIPDIQRLMKSEDVLVKDICRMYEIDRSTLYRYVGPDGERRR